MNIERTEIPEKGGTFIVRFKIAMDKRVEVRMYPSQGVHSIQGVHSKAQISICTATLEAEDMPAYIAMLVMAQAEAVRLNTLYLGEEPSP